MVSMCAKNRKMHINRTPSFIDLCVVPELTRHSDKQRTNMAPIKGCQVNSCTVHESQLTGFII